MEENVSRKVDDYSQFTHENSLNMTISPAPLLSLWSDIHVGKSGLH